MGKMDRRKRATELRKKLKETDKKYSNLALMRKETRDYSAKVVISAEMNQLRRKISKLRKQLKILGQ